MVTRLSGKTGASVVVALVCILKMTFHSRLYQRMIILSNFG
nr:unnamed protein product [Callosobruchus analis]CAI5852129.1 unnamed protein product [Callosobruchus analis]CAI5860977.1 unnamed protein product [Callosobruchus analis]